MQLEKRVFKKNVNNFLTMILTPKKRKDMGESPTIIYMQYKQTNKQMPQTKRVVPSPKRKGRQLQELQFSGGNEK